MVMPVASDALALLEANLYQVEYAFIAYPRAVMLSAKVIKSAFKRLNV